MCYLWAPRAPCSSEYVYDLFITDEESLEVKIHLQMINEFFQLSIELVEPTLLDELIKEEQ